jgi:Tfp pilus assembly protein PilV
MKLLNSSRKQQGFSLFDTMLAITVIAIVFIGVGALFLHAKSNSDVQNTIGDVEGVSSAASQLLNQDYTSQIDQADLIASGLLTDDIISGADLVGPLGAIEFNGSDATSHQSFSITVGGLTADQALTVCQQLVSSYHVNENIEDASGCSDAKFSGTTSLDLYYPKTADRMS